MVLYTNSFDASELLYDTYDMVPTVKQREDSILKEIKIFFNNENFSNAVRLIEKKYEGNLEEINLSEKELWQDIASDSSAIGFIYSYGYEGTYAIAFSKRKQAVVNYFSSD